ncbi:MAG: hypothetical protein VX346_01140 [Planctomycetota bacterium]|nr:hypothetical protein [Planctomycetota bacterium]
MIKNRVRGRWLWRAGVLALVLLCQQSRLFAADGTREFPLGQRQLFLDDVGVARIENLHRTMHRPAKKGAVIRPDPMQPRGTLQIRTAPFWVEEMQAFRFLVADTAGARSLFRWFRSSDGLHWRPGGQPKLGMYMVVYDPQDPDRVRRYKTVRPNEGVAVSPDGIEWMMVPGVPGVPTADEQNLSFDPVNRQFLLSVKRGGPHGRAVALAVSGDFTDWDDYGVVFSADDRDQELGRQVIAARLADATFQQPYFKPDPSVYNVDVYNMGVFRYEGLYIGLPAMYHATSPNPYSANTEGFHLIQLACSRNLKTWRRLGARQAFIGASRRESGAYDLTQMIGPSNAVVRGDELWFYYTALKYRFDGRVKVAGKWVPASDFRADRDAGAVCLAVLRRDGFISLDADAAAGIIETKSFTLAGNRLWVNVDAGDGELGVEILDGAGQVIAQSEPLAGDLLRAPVKWPVDSLTRFKGRLVRLRFTLRNAQFFSYWLE